MTVAAQGTVISYAVQSAKVGAGTFNMGAQTWYKMRAPASDLGTVQDIQVFPLEMGGPLTPTGMFKQGVFYAGTVDMIPRLENYFGYLLKAALGTASTVTDTDADGAAAVGVNTHIFRYDPTDEAVQPWMAWRRVIPGATASDRLGEVGYDGKIATMRLTVPNQGKVAARTAVIARVPAFETNPSWTYSNAAFEDSSTTPDAGRGQFKIAGVDYPVLGVSIDVTNGLSQVQQEMVLGSFYPDDFIALTRNVTLRFVYKWKDPTLYKLVMGNSSSATAWSQTPYSPITVGSDFAFDLRFQSGQEIGATGVPYGMRIRGNKISLATEGPVQAAAGQMVTQAFTAVVNTPDSGSYVEFVVENDATSYA